MGIRFLSRDEIDDKKWDDCIKSSSSNIVYGLTWYLDAITAKKWTAYVLDDYKAVMPFIRKFTFLIPRVIPPLLCQQLGIFSKNDLLSQSNCDTFYSMLKRNMWRFDVKTKTNLPENVHMDIKINHVLLLDKSYEDIEKKYNRNTKRNILQAKNVKLNLLKPLDYITTFEFLMLNDPSGIIKKYAANIKNFMATVHLLNKGFSIVAMENNIIRAAALLIVEDDRLYFTLCASNDKGKKTKAMYLIIDHIIKEYSGSKKIFDFTGSSIENISRRNDGFGSDKEIYYHLTWKRF